MKPEITVITSSRSRLSTRAGANLCDVVFKSDLDLQKFEARATRAGQPRGLGVGDLVYEISNVQKGDSILFSVSGALLTQGDGEYVISLFGKAVDGVLDFGLLDFSNVNFGDKGEWNNDSKRTI